MCVYVIYIYMYIFIISKAIDMPWDSLNLNGYLPVTFQVDSTVDATRAGWMKAMQCPVES